MGDKMPRALVEPAEPAWLVAAAQRLRAVAVTPVVADVTDADVMRRIHGRAARNTQCAAATRDGTRCRNCVGDGGAAALCGVHRRRRG